VSNAINTLEDEHDDTLQLPPEARYASMDASLGRFYERVDEVLEDETTKSLLDCACRKYTYSWGPPRSKEGT